MRKSKAINFVPAVLETGFSRHMKEHMEERYVDLDSLDEPQLMAQYFRNFDLDKNGKIDGLEMLKSIVKMQREEKVEIYQNNFNASVFADDHDEEGTQGASENIESYTEELDEEMEFYDVNKDGYITYGEFMRQHKKRIEENTE